MSFDKKIELERWYEQYSDSVFKYICMMTRDYEQAEDLMHETFIKAFKSIDTFEGRSKVRTYLFRIAHNVTIDYLRKSKPLRIIESVLLNKKDTSPLPEEVINMKESVREIYRALGKLKAPYREVIILRKIKGFSVKEASEVLRWSENKVKVTLHRAMPLLQHELGKGELCYEETR
ncbi:RNA polymerase sigma factor [Evansella cellulosilytica]|uniref:RNA polymerase, sigma-24 subunit, ECF subfamily n=1 Tax=Evansella cellulosilytica (strain ATCC 21833 / DSM 2522 / FERM P-1141 / JCM 9156 / N-4) TaxID=649639 RepID=E6TRB7_EVAC2|nr:RNA polymerase sigma factor [Evansella cellulosilytica]ADU30629.1 RNA polymerase, sigma-24 subunit, ECF subfamily [Evansella cellulosilytica DSM 2522]